jgi:hypothetical protein
VKGLFTPSETQRAEIARAENAEREGTASSGERVQLRTPKRGAETAATAPAMA